MICFDNYFLLVCKIFKVLKIGLILNLYFLQYWGGQIKDKRHSPPLSPQNSILFGDVLSYLTFAYICVYLTYFQYWEMISWIIKVGRLKIFSSIKNNLLLSFPFFKTWSRQKSINQVFPCQNTFNDTLLLNLKFFHHILMSCLDTTKQDLNYTYNCVVMIDM